MQNSAPSELLGLWQQWGKTALGRRLFSRMLGRMVPYSGSIRPQVSILEPGHAEVAMTDQRKFRNHLHSIHAIALANLGELASGLAMIAALPCNTKAIVVHLEIDYLKKARGTLTAIGSAEPPASVTSDLEALAHCDIRDRDGDTVARVTAHWRLRPTELRQ